MVTLPAVVVFVSMLSVWTTGTYALQCPSCLHVHYVKGSVQVASMNAFVNNSQNSLCEADPDAVGTVTCPDTGYSCGFLDEEIDVYAHLVGQVELHFFYRDCVQKPLLNEPFLECLDSQVEEKMFSMLWDKVPDSVISQQPGGSCYCRRMEGCQVYRSNNTDPSGAPCASRWVRIAGRCYEWWIIIVIVVDIIIVVILCILITCCLCRRCPLYYRRNYYKDRKLLGKPRRHSAPEPGYYVGPALADTPVERANIAMPGFGTPLVGEGDSASLSPRRQVALAGNTGYAQPGIYNSRYLYDDGEDQHTTSGRYTWRTARAPRRYRTVYDVQGYFPDEEYDYY